mmetsp:Transcript_10838/g.25126  ORF Transcript_10838/g.25126 Transcript_10838/m.25126 type:complete len:203 (-) Transcript_10838:272-880(-)
MTVPAWASLTDPQDWLGGQGVSRLTLWEKGGEGLRCFFLLGHDGDVLLLLCHVFSFHGMEYFLQTPEMRPKNVGRLFLMGKNRSSLGNGPNHHITWRNTQDRDVVSSLSFSSCFRSFACILHGYILLAGFFSSFGREFSTRDVFLSSTDIFSSSRRDLLCALRCWHPCTSRFVHTESSSSCHYLWHSRILGGGGWTTDLRRQ